MGKNTDMGGFVMPGAPIMATINPAGEAQVLVKDSKQKNGTRWASAVLVGGAAGGDLSGTYPNPTVFRILGNAFTSATPTAGNVFVGNGLSWDSVAPSGDWTIGPTGVTSITAFQGNTLIDATANDGSLLVGIAGAGWRTRVPSGDWTLSNGGVATVTAIQGNAVTAGVPSDAGILVYRSASTAYVARVMSGDATISNTGVITIKTNVALAGSPTTTTQATGTNNTTIATTAYVNARTSVQNSKSAAYTLVLGDAGKVIFHPAADTTARTFTIPANASVAFPIGTEIDFINETLAGVITIAITTDTLLFAGAGSTGSRTLAASGWAKAVKITSTKWIITNLGGLT